MSTLKCDAMCRISGLVSEKMSFAGRDGQVRLARLEWRGGYHKFVVDAEDWDELPEEGEEGTFLFKVEKTGDKSFGLKYLGVEKPQGLPRGSSVLGGDPVGAKKGA